MCGLNEEDLQMRCRVRLGRRRCGGVATQASRAT